MENKQVPVSGIVFLLSLWAFFYCIHSIVDLAVMDAKEGLHGMISLVPNMAVLWAIISGTLFIAGLIIHLYYQKYSDAPACPLLNSRELIAILVAIAAVAIFSSGSSIAMHVADNEDVAKTIETIRDFIEMGALIGVYAVFNPDRFVKKADNTSTVEVKKQQLKELLDSGVLTKEEYDKEINSL